MQIFDAVNRMGDIINCADEQIAHILQRLQNLTRQHNKVNDAIEAKSFDRNKEDNYKSKAIADTVSAYEQRTGEKLSDDITPEILIQILRNQLEFEKKKIVPALEKDLVNLCVFRDGVQEQKETFEEESAQIDNELKAIDADDSLSNEDKRKRKAQILEQASVTALDAQMAAHAAEAEYVEIAAQIQEDKCLDSNASYNNHSNNEGFELNKSALDKLKKIKPILNPLP